MKKYDTVIFDLDGTLTDPGEGVTRSVEYALSKFGFKVDDRRKLYKFIGPPLVDSFEKYYLLRGKDASLAVDFYRERYRKVGIFENTPYSGIEEILSALRELGMTLLVATLKPTEFSVRILERFGFAKYFDFIAGAVMDNYTKQTKADIINDAAKATGTDLSRAVMIGDRHHDMEGASAHRMDSIGVLWGYGDEEELRGSGATYIVKTPSEILDIVK